MQTHNLKRNTPNVKTYRIGRGGKRGKTSGRGGKGQTARAGAKVRPEIRDFIKKLPKLRGRGKNINTSIQTKPVVISLEKLVKFFPEGGKLTPEIMVEKSLLATKKGKVPAVKLLSDGEVSVNFEVSGIKVSKEAKAKIEKAGGTVS